MDYVHVELHIDDDDDDNDNNHDDPKDCTNMIISDNALKKEKITTFDIINVHYYNSLSLNNNFHATFFLAMFCLVINILLQIA